MDIKNIIERFEERSNKKRLQKEIDTKFGLKQGPVPRGNHYVIWSNKKRRKDNDLIIIQIQ